MILRVIVLIAVIVAVLYLVDAYKQLRQGAAARQQELRGGRAPKEPADGHLVACAACGVHVPASRALWAEERGRRTAFCSLACRHTGAPT